MGRAGARFGRGGVIGAMLLAAALAACAAPGAPSGPPTRAELDARGARPLSSDELRELLVGNTLYHVNPANGVKVPLHYLPDGTRYVRLRGQQIASRWRIERGLVCEDSVVARKEVCRAIYRPAAGRGVICEEGEARCSYWMDWAAGNRETLGK